MPEFWKSAGLHLLSPTSDGWLGITPDFIRAYLKRPEVHPIDTSCAVEVGLHEALMTDPLRPVSAAEIERIADADAIDTYRVVLNFRDILIEAGSVEGAYLRLAQRGAASPAITGAPPAPPIPPVFLDQLVHLICRNMLADVRDPMRLRAAEILFRDQTVTTDGGRLMLADEEIVEMHARAGETGLAQLLAETGTPLREVALDVLDDTNKDGYWARSDRFDTVMDLRFGQPALDALARVIETWLAHLLRIDVSVEPRPRIEDKDWRWHIGLDQHATTLLNALYEGKSLSLPEMERIVALLRMRICDDRLVVDRVKGRPIYLGLAMSPGRTVKMKPQNLLVNLPLVRSS